MLILVAEDLDDAREVLRLLLELDGHRVCEATNGREAVEVAMRDAPDVILMDLNMPVMDGLAAVRSLRAHASARRTPIIALSAQSDLLSRGDALAAGCDDYFTKPVNFEVLASALARLAQEADARARDSRSSPSHSHGGGAEHPSGRRARQRA